MTLQRVCKSFFFLQGWSQALGLLQQVTPGNLKYDMMDTKLMT